MENVYVCVYAFGKQRDATKSKLWIDHDHAIELHLCVTGAVEEQQQQLKLQRQTPQQRFMISMNWMEWRTFYSRPHGLQRLNDIIFIFTWKMRCNWDLLAKIRLTIFFINTHFENKFFCQFLRILFIFFLLFTVEKVQKREKC